MKESFDHYLKGKPAPKWWMDGVLYLKLKDHLDERAKDLSSPVSGSRERQ